MRHWLSTNQLWPKTRPVQYWETQLELSPETVQLRDSRAVTETETPPPVLPPFSKTVHRPWLFPILASYDVFASRGLPDCVLSAKWVVSRHVLVTKGFPWSQTALHWPWQFSHLTPTINPHLSSFVETSLALFHPSRSLDPWYQALGSCGAPKCPTESWEPNLFYTCQLETPSYQGLRKWAH